MVQLGFFFHMKMALGSQTVVVTRPLIFAISFMLFFSVVIALFKDIPDVKGDAQVLAHLTCVTLSPFPVHACQQQCFCCRSVK